MSEPVFIPYHPPVVAEPEKVSAQFYNNLNYRRSVREFSDRPVSQEVIENLIKTAGTAPSGAHKQPWTFVAVQDPDIKHKIRLAAEKEEQEFYSSRAPQEWLNDLKPFGTDWQKPFLEKAPWLVVIFKKVYSEDDAGRHKNYYVQESVGIASGFFITAVHQAGLSTLTHTPSPMNFLSEILERPQNEKPFLLLPVGYAAADAQVPDIKRKGLNEIAVFK